MNRQRAWLGAIAAGGAFIGLMAASGAASAQVQGHAPWCVDLGDLGNGYLECEYYTYAQCAARASGISNICVLNSWYVPDRRRRESRSRREHRR